MKILFGYLTTAYRGGTKYQLDIARVMANSQVGFLTSNAHLEYEDRVCSLGPIHRIPPTKRFFQRWKALKALAGEYDVLYLNKATLHPLELILAACSGFQIVVFHSHATGKDTSNPLTLMAFHALHYLSVPFVNLAADKLYACSIPAARWLFGKRNVAATKVIPNGIDLAAYTYRPEIREKKRAELAIDGPCVLHVGAFSGVKNQGYLVEGFQIFHKNHPDSVLLLVGDGELRPTVQAQVEALGMTDCVRLMGQRNDVAEIMQAADLLVLPSLREGLPFVAVEAQAAGLPCLLTSTAAPESRITDLCDWIDINRPAAELAAAMEQQITLPRRDTFCELSQAGYDLVTCGRELEEELNQLLRQSK